MKNTIPNTMKTLTLNLANKKQKINDHCINGEDRVVALSSQTITNKQQNKVVHVYILYSEL